MTITTMSLFSEISLGEKIENHQLSEKPALGLSVWKKNDGEWQWIAHA